MSRTLSAVLAAVVLVAALVVGTSAMARPPVLLTGHVVGSDTHPVAGGEVDVHYRAKSARAFSEAGVEYTDTAGSWEFAGRAGEYRIVIQAAGASPVVLFVDAAAGMPVSVDTTLPSFGTIAGFVSGAGGAPVPEAVVEFYLRQSDGEWPDAPTSSAQALDGAYQSDLLPSGLYMIRATAPGFAASYYVVDGTPAVTDVDRGLVLENYDIALGVAMGSITGRVLYPDGVTGYANAYVWIYRQNPDGSWPVDPGYPTLYYRQVRSLADGTYDSGLMPAGFYRIRFFTMHNGSQYWEYVLTPDAATSVEIANDGETISGIDCWYGHTAP